MARSSDFNSLPKICFVFVTIAVARLVSALWNNVNDCDESYNYWEPSHFVMYGKGFQTWEYSPLYAIRSYAYLWLYIKPAMFVSMFTNSKIVVFYGTRVYLALVSALCETFLNRVIHVKLNRQIANFYWTISLFSAGMFVSSTSFLPSSFGLYITCLVVGFWLQQRFVLFIFATAFGALIGWPFTAAISLPFAFQLITSRRYVKKFIVASSVSAIIILIPIVAIDSYYYGKIVLPTLNILLYNVFSKHGPDLYGTEPFSFYLLNLFLNFNIVTLFAFASQPILFVYCFTVKPTNLWNQLCITSSLMIWCAIFFNQAHKEERFLYPVYPLISLNAAISLDNLFKLIHQFGIIQLKNIKIVFNSIIIVFGLLSLSRILALHNGYRATIQIYEHFHEFANEETRLEKTLCLGKEWHRFPSHFFIPDNVKVSFIASEFRGQLPKSFDRSSDHPTRIIPTEMNDLNREEESRYVSITECDFLIDSDYPEYAGRDLPYAKDTKHWRIEKSFPFLDHQRSSMLFRAFYVPFLSNTKCQYIGYNLLVRKIN